MKAPAIRRFPFTQPERHGERGITMVLVALAMVAIIAMAALSIDVVTLYLAKEEAQRSADAAALAAARVISISGITGTGNTDIDTASWSAICGTSGAATQTAQAVGKQNSVANVAASDRYSHVLSWKRRQFRLQHRLLRIDCCFRRQSHGDGASHARQLTEFFFAGLGKNGQHGQRNRQRRGIQSFQLGKRRPRRGHHSGAATLRKTLGRAQPGSYESGAQ